jgi:hypothetical protein
MLLLPGCRAAFEALRIETFHLEPQTRHVAGSPKPSSIWDSP